MSFKSVFSKIFGKKNTEANASEKSFTLRAPRVKVLPLHDLRFEKADPRGKIQISIHNVSTTGIGLIRTPLTSWAVSGSEISGSVFLKNIEYPCSLSIVHVADAQVGCIFTRTTTGFREALNEYFRSEIAALDLIRVESRLLEQPEKGSPHRFLGTNNCELYYVQDADDLLFFTLSFFGNYIEWWKGEKARFGKSEEFKDRKPHRKTTEVNWTSGLSPQVLSAILKFIDHIDQADPKIRLQIARVVQTAANA